MGSFAWWLSLALGFLSLSQEILWVRVISFAHSGAPHAFSFVLTSYLVGIAVGAAIGKKICNSGVDLYRAAGLVLAGAGAFDLLLPWATPMVVRAGNDAFLGAFLLVACASAIKSILFPIAHQLGSDSSGPRVGRSVSRIYFANIIGSTLGPLVTGFVLLDRLPVERCFELSGWVCLGLAAACGARAAVGRLALPAALAVAPIAWAVVPLPPQPMLQKMAGLSPARVGHFLANKHGVVHTLRDPGGDIVYGGNVYDGRATVDVDANLTRLDRLYVLAALHPAPKRVLVIGLSAGGWTRAVLGFPSVEHVDVVEINPAYLTVIESHPDLRPVLTDPRVRIHIDDGRRWIKRHAQERYDLIIQNTTWNWRSSSTNLLSVEYMTQVLESLAPGGIATFNTTGSLDVIATAHAAFPHAARYVNFVYGSNAPLELRKERLATVRRPDGRLFDLAAATPESVASHILAARTTPASTVLMGASFPVVVITDDNMVTEYRHGRHFAPLQWLYMYDRPPSQ